MGLTFSFLIVTCCSWGSIVFVVTRWDVRVLLWHHAISRLLRFYFIWGVIWIYCILCVVFMISLLAKHCFFLSNCSWLLLFTAFANYYCEDYNNQNTSYNYDEDDPPLQKRFFCRWVHRCDWVDRINWIYRVHWISWISLRSWCTIVLGITISWMTHSSSLTLNIVTKVLISKGVAVKLSKCYS